MTPVVAATGEEALALSQGDGFRAVIADVHMPGMGGLAMLQQLSPMQPNAKFVVVTGGELVSPEALPRGHRACVFAKPWPEEELAAAIRDDVRSSTSSHPPPRSAVRPAPSRVLLIEDDPGDALLFQTALRLAYPGQFTIQHADSFQAARDLVHDSAFDVAALDLSLGDTEGLATIAQLQLEAPELGLVIFSGTDDSDFALKALQAGAQDYLVKGKVGGATLGKALRYAEQRKRTELRLSDLAFHDQLTGLANRTLFRQRIAQALARSRRAGTPFAVLLLDMDRFKAVNDALGHDAGDVYLYQVAERLKEATRETDTVARLGGDEFAILAEPLQSPEDVERLARRVLATLSRPLQISGVVITPSASIGAALYPDSGEDSDTLLAASDAAMYVVKGKGRNGFHLHGVQLTEQATRRLALEGALRKAVADRQLVLHYQPQISLVSDFRGAEALLRWPTADGKLIAAAEFVPVLEDSGLLLDMGPWIIRTACQQLAKWRASGGRVDRLAVNISAKQFVVHDLRSVLNNAIEAAGLIPQDLELELTETALLHDDETSLGLLESLSRDGFRITLDDFGTGYCSLAYLQRFPIAAIKIDKSFVADIDRSSRRVDLVGGIMQLARRLGIDVIAEGVETVGQLEALRNEGCELVQGFLMGMPMPGDSFLPRWSDLNDLACHGIAATG